MDTTVEYIEMCTKATDIQELWSHSRRTSGDWYYHMILDKVYPVTYQDQDDKYCFWVPTQSQMQEMLGNKLSWSIRQQKHALDKMLTPQTMHTFDTFEKAWMAVVMKNLYWKEWNPYSKVWEEKLVNKKRFI